MMNYVLVVRKLWLVLSMNNRKILVVNDDGYDALGIQILAKHLTKYGDVTVFAPSEGQSAQSQAITCFKPLKMEEVIGLGYKCYKVFGKPADCVRLATGLDNYDLVVSGINNGFNIGIDTLYSGTVGAACDANLHGISSIALSAPRGMVAEFEFMLDDVLDKCFEIEKIFNGNMYCLNVNFPKNPSEVKGFKITRVGYFVDDLMMIEYNDGFKPAKYNLDYNKNDLTIDYAAHEAGYISISPLTWDKTHIEHLELLKKNLN